MEHNQIDLKSIQELRGMNFFIPDYQRGYRWTKQQVDDLLDDIWEFMNNGSDGWYSLQPVVVTRNIPKKLEKSFRNELKKITEAIDDSSTIMGDTVDLVGKYSPDKYWEVVDGQQRLTALFIVLKYLEKDWYLIEYETRNVKDGDSGEFLNDIDAKTESEASGNIDYYHMFQTYKAVEKWFEINNDVDKSSFLSTILKSVKVIWYEIKENPINVFTRINSGKIPLTNAELIKALFLNSSNFKGDDAESLRLKQLEIAIEWDQIEYALQDDEFWLFFNDYSELESPTRIDFLFDLVCEKNLLDLSEEKLSKVGNDKDKTFRYFNYYLESGDNKIYKAWAEIKTLFSILKEWYNDLKLFHYVGFLIEVRDKKKHTVKTIISAMLEEWSDEDTTKEDFIKTYIIPQIQSKIKKGNDTIDLSLLEYGDSQVRSVLLLHNIQTIINQNDILEGDDKYKMPVFYKFPFHLYKKESWNVEHIDSATENNLTNVKDQKEWLFFSKDYVSKNQILKIKKDDDSNEKMSVKLIDQINEFIKCAEPKNFEDLATNIMQDEGNRLGANEKDKLWNLCLLDEKTNKGYGNDIFPVKRRKIIAKSRGKTLKVNLTDGSIIEDRADTAFVPICTEKVFQKAYNPIPNNLREWDKDDALAYKEHITETLDIFIKKEEG